MAALGIQHHVEDLAAAVKRRDGVDMRLRIGLNSGQVIAGEIGSGALGYTTVGEHVGMAQRMEAAAPAGGVMLSAATARLVDGVAALGEPQLVTIKGAGQPVSARQLLSVGVQRSVGRAETSLVGRHWEMSAVEGLLDRAIDGYGAVVSVVGPAGIGKSRLAREVAAMAARRGVNVFTAVCESHASQVPFQVITRLLRAATGVDGLDAPAARALVEAQFAAADSEDVLLFEDLLGVRDPDAELPQIDPDARRRRLTALVNTATLANTTPAVYVVEDAHWIDEVSESMLAEFLTVVPQTPLLTLITYRPEYRGALTQVPGAQTIALAPLRGPETGALVGQLLGGDPSVFALGATIAERAAGTPFFAEEIVRELAERGVLQGNPGAYVSTAQAAEVSVPATLQAAIAARIDRLDPRAKRTLSAASVVGSRFGLDLLTRLGIEPEMTSLVAAQLVDQVTFTAKPEFVFHHPLIRAVAYEAQLKSDRAELHRLVAAAIEEQSAGSLDEKAALIAEHLEAAGDLRAAFDWHMRAGAWSNNRDVAAARLSWERACKVADALPDDDADRLAKRIAPRTVLRATDWRVHADDSGAGFEELRELCALAGDKTSLALGMLGPLGWRAQRGQVREAQQLSSELLAMLDSIGDLSLTAQAGFGAIGIKMIAGEMNEVLRWAQATIEWTGGDGAKGNLVIGSPLAVALGYRGIARCWLGLSGWREDLDRAGALAEQSAEPLILAMVLSWRFGMAIWYGALGVDDAVVRGIEDALQTVQAAGDNYAVVMVEWLLSCILLLRGTEEDRFRGRELLVCVRDVATRRQSLGSELSLIEMYEAREHVRDGDRDAGVAVMRRSVADLLARGQVGYYVPAFGMLIEALLERNADGDVAEAEELITQLAAAPADGSVVRDIWVLRLRTMLARARGDAGYRDLRGRTPRVGEGPWLRGAYAIGRGDAMSSKGPGTQSLAWRSCSRRSSDFWIS